MRRFPHLRRVARFWWIPVSFLLLILLVPLLWIAVVCEPFSDLPEATMAEADATAWETTENLTGYRRAEEQTYLTFPEWYIVYSAEEYAAFIQEKPRAGFPISVQWANTGATTAKSVRLRKTSTPLIAPIT